MERVAINVYFNGEDFTSDYSDMSDDEVSRLKSLCEKISGGEVSYFNFKSNNILRYFPKEILSKSIISIVFDKSTK